jgi:hypothetical protein
MEESLRIESEKLAHSWMQHDPAWLQDYLVADVEDPRVNLQSILSRHFLTESLYLTQFGALMEQEYAFAAATRWLFENPAQGTAEDGAAVLYSLRRGADNAEGLTIPHWLLELFSHLPTSASGVQVPNYIEEFLLTQAAVSPDIGPRDHLLRTFCRIWKTALAGAATEAEGSKPPTNPSPATLGSVGPRALGMTLGRKPSVLEPACGSANDYRFLDACGISSLIDYVGFDLCENNVNNAIKLFPDAQFQVGNVFEIDAPKKAFDLCVVHDLFEHLSPAGFHKAIAEVCRVTRRGMCVGFFQMDEIGEHVIRPRDEYHWNMLSMSRTRELFLRHGFSAQVLHVGTFLREKTGCGRTHNPNAYTFVLRPKENGPVGD